MISFLLRAAMLAGGVLLTGLLLLAVAYMLPTGRMKSHIAESDEVFNYEGIYPQLMYGVKSSQLDNYTDGLMYATAIHPGSGNVLRDAMYNARYEYEDTNMVQALNDYANDVSVKESLRYELGYARYWHGYLIILKPLLLFLNVGEIRMLNLIMQTLFLSVLLYLIIQKYGAPYAVPVIMTVLLLNPVALPLSLQFSWVYHISLLGSILILYMKQVPEDNIYLFLFIVLGMLTSYFDLLTYPLITLGLPLVLFLPKCMTLSPVKRILRTAATCILWFGGYAAMWIGKWIFAFIFGHINLLQELSYKISERTSMRGYSEERITLLATIAKVLKVALNKPYVFIFISLFIGYFIWIAYQRNKGGKERKNDIKDILLYILPYVFIALLPFMWFGFFANHTYIHYWFAYRELGVTVVAVGTMALELMLGYNDIGTDLLTNSKNR